MNSLPRHDCPQSPDARVRDLHPCPRSTVLVIPDSDGANRDFAATWATGPKFGIRRQVQTLSVCLRPWNESGLKDVARGYLTRAVRKAEASLGTELAPRRMGWLEVIDGAAHFTGLLHRLILPFIGLGTVPFYVEAAAAEAAAPTLFDLLDLAS